MSQRGRARGAGAVEYMVGVALVIGLVLASMRLLGGALQGGALCEARGILAFESLCGRSGALRVGDAPAAAGPVVPAPDAALVCDKLGCRAAVTTPISADVPAPPPPPEDPAVKRRAAIAVAERALADLRASRAAATTSSQEDRLDNAIARAAAEVDKLKEEAFGPNVDWAKATDPPRLGPGGVASLLGVDAGDRKAALALLSPSDKKELFRQAGELSVKLAAERRELDAALASMSTSTIEDLKRRIADLDARAKVFYDGAYTDSSKNRQTRDAGEKIAQGQALSGQARRLRDIMLARQRDALDPVQRDKLDEVARLQPLVGALLAEQRTAHLPPLVAADTSEAVRSLTRADILRAWAAAAEEKLEGDAVTAFERSLAGRADRAAIEADIAVQADALRSEIRGKLPAKAHADFDRSFVAKAFIGEDGKITVALFPTPELRKLQTAQALHAGYERIEFSSRRVAPFDPPATSRDALSWWLTYGRTEPRKLAKIIEPNHAIRATNDEFLLVPAGTLMRVGTGLTVRQLAVMGTKEIATNVVLVAAAEKVAEKYGPAAGAATPFAVMLTAVLTRRMVVTPRVSAATPAIAAETKALLVADARATVTAESKVAAVAEAKVAVAEAKAATAEATSAARPVSKADAARLISESEGVAFGPKNVGHAREHVPLPGQDPAALAMSKVKDNNTVFRHGRHGEQALRDIMNQNEAALKALKPGEVAKGTLVIPETVPGLNSVKGAVPTKVDIREVTWMIGRRPDGSFHLLHFSPKVLVAK